MNLLRLYVPVSAEDVQRLHADGALGAGATAYGVSPALSAATPRVDEEEREYLAFLDAVTAAADIAGPQQPLLVMAIDLPDNDIQWPTSGTATVVSREVLLREAVAFHVGEEPGADADLLWYDVTELASVTDLLGGEAAPDR